MSRSCSSALSCQNIYPPSSRTPSAHIYICLLNFSHSVLLCHAPLPCVLMSLFRLTSSYSHHSADGRCHIASCHIIHFFQLQLTLPYPRHSASIVAVTWHIRGCCHIASSRRICSF